MAYITRGARWYWEMNRRTWDLLTRNSRASLAVVLIVWALVNIVALG